MPTSNSPDKVLLAATEIQPRMAMRDLLFMSMFFKVTMVVSCSNIAPDVSSSKTGFLNQSSAKSWEREKRNGKPVNSMLEASERRNSMESFAAGFSLGLNENWLDVFSGMESTLPENSRPRVGPMRPDKGNASSSTARLETRSGL